MIEWPRVMVTGHRPQKMTGAQMQWAQPELDRLARKLISEHGTEWAISGMALGADTWWASSALAYRLKLWAFIPFPQQADRWGETDREIWENLRSRATLETVVSDHYSVANLLERNSAMVAACDAAIAVWSPSSGRSGTADAIAKIQQSGKPLIVVDIDRLITVIR